MNLLEALRYAWDVGMPIKSHGNDRLAWNGRSYNAERIGEGDLAIRLLIHDTNHYRVAGERRRLVEFGLGGALYTSTNPELRVSDEQASRDEAAASTLDALILTRLGDSGREIRSWLREGLDNEYGHALVDAFRREVRGLFRSGILQPRELCDEIRETFKMLKDSA